ncbi:MAG: AbiEi antitoxin N-terminal domain-containing protein [Bacteroidales bacterium]|nr:AbiEi antitoxin N-terminal domain-containing protein [Bacteroidales bacterium]
MALSQGRNIQNIINLFKRQYPPTSILLASTLQKEGISRDSIQDYVNSGWLVPYSFMGTFFLSAVAFAVQRPSAAL